MHMHIQETTATRIAVGSAFSNDRRFTMTKNDWAVISKKVDWIRLPTAAANGSGLFSRFEAPHWSETSSR